MRPTMVPLSFGKFLTLTTIATVSSQVAPLHATTEIIASWTPWHRQGLTIWQILQYAFPSIIHFRPFRLAVGFIAGYRVYTDFNSYRSQ